MNTPSPTLKFSRIITNDLRVGPYSFSPDTIRATLPFIGLGVEFSSEALGETRRAAVYLRIDATPAEIGKALVQLGEAVINDQFGADGNSLLIGSEVNNDSYPGLREFVANRPEVSVPIPVSGLQRRLESIFDQSNKTLRDYSGAPQPNAPAP